MDTFTKVLNTKGLYKRQQKDSSSWVVKGRIKGGKVVTVTIGDTKLYKQAEAKQKTLDILKMMSEGINPNEVKKAEQEINRLRGFTLEQAIAECSKLSQWKNSTRKDIELVMNRRFKDWFKRPLASITKQECLNRFNQIKLDIKRNNRQKNRSSVNDIGEGEAQKAFRYLNAIFNTFIEDDIGEVKLLPKGNPCSILKTKKVRKTLISRERYLDLQKRMKLHEELKASSDLEEYQGRHRIKKDDRDLIMLLIHTGLRLEEALNIKWSDVHLDNENYLITNTKNRRKHLLPMTEDIKNLFNRRNNNGSIYVFPSPLDNRKALSASKIFKRVSEEVGFNFSAHDLRRTVATVAAECGYDVSNIGALLNHSQRTVTEGYVQRTQPRLKRILEDVENALFMHDSERTTQ
jgi:integrase